jgi:hypothetical protein
MNSFKKKKRSMKTREQLMKREKLGKKSKHN